MGLNRLPKLMGSQKLIFSQVDFYGFVKIYACFTTVGFFAI